MNIKDLLKDAYKEGMTVEEIESALKDISLLDDNSAELERLKNALSKSNSEAADYKKQLREKMSEDEQKKQKEQEERDTMQKELEALRRESLVSKNKSRLIALGYEEALADETAEAMADGKIEKVFANQKKHLEAFEKKVRAEALKNTPKPTGDGDGKTITLKDFRAMSPADRLKFSREHPDEYKELYTGGN